MLLHHVVEYRSDAFLCESWVRHADDCFKAAVEDTGLFFDVAELLVLDVDGTVSCTNSQIIDEEMASEGSRPEFDLSSLRCRLRRL